MISQPGKQAIAMAIAIQYCPILQEEKVIRR